MYSTFDLPDLRQICALSVNYEVRPHNHEKSVDDLTTFIYFTFYLLDPSRMFACDSGTSVVLLYSGYIGPFSRISPLALIAPYRILSLQWHLKIDKDRILGVEGEDGQTQKVTSNVIMMNYEVIPDLYCGKSA